MFFNSAATSGDLATLVGAVPGSGTLIVIDGYHGFMALPTDLSGIAARAFYLAGGYKYAMAGEGACFMHCPPGYAPRPRDTGWFAAFGALTGEQRGVPYGRDGSRFLGATFDPSGLYRLAAVLDWIDAIGLTVEAIHAHVMELEALFLKEIAGIALAAAGAPRHPGTAARTLPHLRDRRRASDLPASCGRKYRQRRAGEPHPLRLRLLSRRRGDRARGRGGCAGTRLTSSN